MGDETDKSSKIIKEKIEFISEKVKEVSTFCDPLLVLTKLLSFKIILKSDLAKKAAEFGDEAATQAKKAAESVSKHAQNLSETKAFKTVSEVSVSAMCLVRSTN